MQISKGEEKSADDADAYSVEAVKVYLLRLIICIEKVAVLNFINIDDCLTDASH